MRERRNAVNHEYESDTMRLAEVPLMDGYALHGVKRRASQASTPPALRWPRGTIPRPRWTAWSSEPAIRVATTASDGVNIKVTDVGSGYAGHGTVACLAEIDNVRRSTGADPLIGTHVRCAGCGYGGSCREKDVQTLIRTAEQVGSPLHLLPAVEQADEMFKRVAAVCAFDPTQARAVGFEYPGIGRS